MNRQDELQPFRQCYIAHRGLFDNESDHPENTLAAFRRAVSAGYGIELDVQLTADDVLVVIHDDDLKRVCGEDVLVKDLTYDELRRRHILASEETVPLFSDVLEAIGGRVPLIVEVKTGPQITKRCRMTDEALRHYRGVYCVESFDPRAVLWWRVRHPSVIRGQLGDVMTGGAGAWALTNMVFNLVTWPDFIAYNHRRSSGRVLAWWHRVLGCTMVAWTIKSQAELKAARRRGFRVFIFDSFIPDE